MVRTVKSQPKRASDEAVPTAAPRKQVVASDDQGHSRVPQLEASLAGVIASLSGDSHGVISNVLRAYDRLVLKESCSIHANQENIKEAQHLIKKSWLNIERVQKSLVDDIRVVVKSSNTDEVRAGTSPHDIHATK
jgi:predicted DNA-binding protein (MmcQ/YjbR family)